MSSLTHLAGLVLVLAPALARADGPTGPTGQRFFASIAAGPQTFVGDCYECGYGDRVETHLRGALGLRVAGGRSAALYLVLPVDVSWVMNGGPVQGNETMFNYLTTAVTPGVEARIAITTRTAVAFEAGYGTWNTDVSCFEDCDGFLVNGPHSVIRLGIGLRHALSQRTDLVVDVDAQLVQQASFSRPYVGAFVGVSYDLTSPPGPVHVSGPPGS